MRPWTWALAPLAPKVWALAWLAVSGYARADPVPDKKVLLRILKVLPASRSAPSRHKAPVTLFNLKTHEALPVLDVLPGRTDWSRLLRCHFTGTVAWVDPRLAGEAVAAARKFGADRVEILSGYRDPKYNRLLRKKGRDVASQSRHTRGQAVDFRLPGVATTRLRDWLLRRGAFGVGYYPDSGFVHLDVGPPRRWSGQ